MSADSPAALLIDSSGNYVGVLLDGSIYRLQVLGKVTNASGTQINPATEDTLALIKDADGIKKITDPVFLDVESPKLLDSAMLLEGIYKELQRIRVLLEHLTDETVDEHDLETRD
jgi:hypothetical protein